MVVPFALGVWVALYFGQLFDIVHLLVMSLVLFAMTVVASRFIRSWRFRWVFGAVLHVLLFLLGSGMVLVKVDKVQKNDILNVEKQPDAYVARLWEYPTERDNSYKVILDMEYAVYDSSDLVPVSGKVMTYFAKEDSMFELEYGDLILISEIPSYVSPPANPHEFDYRQYLARKGILHQVYLKDGSWVDLKINSSRWIYRVSYRLRDVLLNALHKSGIEGDEFGVAAAILLGYDDSLPFALRQDYVAAGSMHILCVSGMHVGVLFLLVSFLLGFLKFRKWQKTIKQIILLLVIWTYAFVCGLSPSILRSTFMLTFVVFGEIIGRKGFALNSIAASAFILLCINPYNLLDLGFILSYSAVVGIVVMQKPIYNLIYIKNKRLDYLWEITSVALAAQLATAPFTIYYFNQFPVYFWLANLVLTPLSSVIIIGGMIMLMVSFIPYVNIACGWVVSGLIFIMNWVVGWIEGLPYSIIKGLYLTDWEFLAFLIAVGSLLMLVRLRERKLIFPLLSALLFISVSLCVRTYEGSRQVVMNVYNVKKHTAIEFVNGFDHVLLVDSALLDDEQSVRYSMEGNWVSLGLSSTPKYYVLESDIDDVPYVVKHGNMISFAGKVMALWDNNPVCDDSLSYRIPVGYMFVNTNTKPQVESIEHCFDVETYVLNGNLTSKRTEKWNEEIEKSGLKSYSVRNEGALVVEF